MRCSDSDACKPCVDIHFLFPATKSSLDYLYISLSLLIFLCYAERRPLVAPQGIAARKALAVYSEGEFH